MVFSRDLKSIVASTSRTTPVSRRTLLKRTGGALAIAALPTISMARGVRGIDVSSLQSGDELEVVDGPLNSRAGPGLSYAVVETLQVGYPRIFDGTAPVVADGYTWLSTYPPGVGPGGWLAAEFVREVSPGAIGRRRLFEVVDGPLYVRAGAGLAAEVVSSVPVGTQGTTAASDPVPTVPADGYTWAKVTFYNSLDGWIALEFVQWIS